MEQTFIDRLIIKLFDQSRCIPHNTKLLIRLTLHETSFYLKAENGTAYTNDTIPRLSILEAPLYVPKWRFANALTKSVETARLSKNIIMPFKNYNAASYTISSGVQAFVSDIRFQGVLPDTVICGIVEDAAFVGAIDKNPFYFENADATEVYLHHSSNRRRFPALEYKQKFGTVATEDILKSYQSFLDQLGYTGNNSEAPALSVNAWAYAHTLWYKFVKYIF